MVIDDDLAAVIQGNARVVEVETAGEGASADADETDVDVESDIGVVLRVEEVELHALGLVVDTRVDFGVQLELQTLLFERVLEGFAHLGVQEGTDAVSVLDHRHVRAKALVNTTKFEANNATANNRHSLRDLLQRKGAR